MKENRLITAIVLFLILSLCLSLFATSGGVGAQGPEESPYPPPDSSLTESNIVVDLFVDGVSWLAKLTGNEVELAEPELARDVNFFYLWRMTLWPNLRDNSPMSQFIRLSSPFFLILTLAVLVVALPIMIINQFRKESIEVEHLMGFVLGLMFLAILFAAQTELLMFPIDLSTKIVDAVSKNVATTVGGDNISSRLLAIIQSAKTAGFGGIFNSSTRVATLMGLMMYEYSFFSLCLWLMGVITGPLALLTITFTRSIKALTPAFSIFLSLCGVMLIFAVLLQFFNAQLTSADFLANLHTNLPMWLVILMVVPPGSILIFWTSVKVAGKTVKGREEERMTS